MSRSLRERLADILEAIEAAQRYDADGAVLRDPMAYDAVRMRIVEIGEAAVELERSGVAAEMGWRDVIGMRNVLAHQYWRSDAQVVHDTVAHDLPGLAAEVTRLLDGLT